MPNFPNESTEYREAREKLLTAEARLREDLERVAALRRQLPLGGEVNKDYTFEGISENGEKEPVKLSELFESGKESLLIYSYMYGPEMENSCPLCTAFLDSMNGHVKHITERMNLAIVACSPIERIAEFAKTRDWKDLPLLSASNNSYARDYLAEDEKGNQMPMANVFVKRDGKVRHFWGSELLYKPFEGHDFRHVDLLWPLWNFFDLTPEGRGENWYPSLNYEEQIHQIGGAR